jgi:competence protein ComEA
MEIPLCKIIFFDTINEMSKSPFLKGASMKKIVFTGVFLFYFCIFSACGNSYFEDVEASSEEVLTEEEYEEEETSGTEIYVQVDGAVKSPGVYQLMDGARVYEAIELAGGFNEAADATDLNQADKFSDGQKIYVPTISESEESDNASGISADGKVNINRATAEELMTLPGIGESKAKDIISYRETNGSFAKIEDIMNIPGIKDGVFNKISGSITVD